MGRKSMGNGRKEEATSTSWVSPFKYTVEQLN